MSDSVPDIDRMLVKIDTAILSKSLSDRLWSQFLCFLLIANVVFWISALLLNYSTSREETAMPQPKHERHWPASKTVDSSFGGSPASIAVHGRDHVRELRSLASLLAPDNGVPNDVREEVRQAMLLILSRVKADAAK